MLYFVHSKIFDGILHIFQITIFTNELLQGILLLMGIFKAIQTTVYKEISDRRN